MVSRRINSRQLDAGDPQIMVNILNLCYHILLSYDFSLCISNDTIYEVTFWMTGQVPNIRHAIPDKAAESDVVISQG